MTGNHTHGRLTTGGGSVEVFENENDAKSRYEYVDAITRGSALCSEYHWLEGTSFLRVSRVDTTVKAASDWARSGFR
jgi:hypothetical protein